MRKIVCLFCAIVMTLVMASTSDAGFFGRGRLNVNVFTTGIQSQAVFVQQPVFVPFSTVVVQSQRSFIPSYGVGNGVNCGAGIGINANIGLRGGVGVGIGGQRQVIRQRTVIR